uniref:Uncharacterized protein n=1 Tax=Romanomermis culicivorax TaxID=13658 RepID=A0A915JG27_ROMCU
MKQAANNLNSSTKCTFLASNPEIFLLKENHRQKSFFYTIPRMKETTENNELKIALSKTDIGAEIDPSSTSKASPVRSRRSLSEIDSMSQSYTRLNEQLATQVLSIKDLKRELDEKEDIIQKLKAAPIAGQLVKMEVEGSSIDRDMETALQEKDKKIEYLMQRIGLTKLSDCFKSIFRKTTRVIRILFALLKGHCNLLSFTLFSFGQHHVVSTEQKVDYDPQETRIIHISVANPLEIAHNNKLQELDTLRKNNTILSLRVEELEKMRASNSCDLPCTSSEVPLDVTSSVQQRLKSMKYEQEIENLNVKISKVTEQRDRVTKSFMEKTAHYREICSYLLGYDIKLTDGNHLTVRSLYESSASQTDDKRFVIQHSASGEYHLMSNKYVEEWKDDFVEMYLSNDNSFPAFFAAVTLQLYNKEKGNTS